MRKRGKKREKTGCGWKKRDKGLFLFCSVALVEMVRVRPGW